ncbi:hypothetical protein B0H10DRAFT_2215942 [Mycena sp. CBHHK59/15]|nr:hypothetical protein B0H10DRAFT_2215942 [Mycena sp. CBHHK59/15]
MARRARRQVNLARWVTKGTATMWWRRDGSGHSSESPSAQAENSTRRGGAPGECLAGVPTGRLHLSALSSRPDYPILTHDSTPTAAFLLMEVDSYAAASSSALHRHPHPSLHSHSHSSSSSSSAYDSDADSAHSLASHHSNPAHASMNGSYPPRRGASLQVSTAGLPPDPAGGEHTARPGNAHLHAQFHSQSLPLPGQHPQPHHLDSSGLLTMDPAEEESEAYLGGMGMNGVDGVGSSAHGLGLSGALSRPLTVHEGERLAYLDRLKFFLATAPSRWDVDDAADGGLAASLAHQPTSTPTTHPALNRFLLPSQEYVSCVLWNGLYHITGTDIVRALVFRFEAFARPVRNMKKFEEGVFSDLRNLKPGADACLEEPKGVGARVSSTAASSLPPPLVVVSLRLFLFLPPLLLPSPLLPYEPNAHPPLSPQSPFLDLLFKYQCIRTQKKQKVFYWCVFSSSYIHPTRDDACLSYRRALPLRRRRRRRIHLYLFLPLHFPSVSLSASPSPLSAPSTANADPLPPHRFSVPHDRLFLDALERDLKREKMGLEPTTQITGEPALSFTYDAKRSLYEQFVVGRGGNKDEGELESAVEGRGVSPHPSASSRAVSRHNSGDEDGSAAAATPFFAMFSLFEGSPTYKQRRKKSGKPSGLGPGGEEEEHRGRSAGRYIAGVPGGADEQMIAGAAVGLTAAEMFIKQARGELRSGGGSGGGRGAAYYGGHVQQLQHHEQMLAAFQQQQTQRPRSHEETMREAYAANQQQTAQQAAAAQAQAQQQQQQPGSAGYANSGFPATAGTNSHYPPPAELKTKAFICPLFSCGRLFKRMEHLRRHLRTHTMERPFACPRCNKRFSRSDNLNQHVRTHVRAEGLAGGAAGAAADWGGGGASGGEEEESGGEGEEVDELAGDDDVGGPGGIGLTLGMYGGPAGVGLGMGMGGGMGGVAAGARMCEVEVPGDVREVVGDEEGLMMRTASAPAGGEFFGAGAGAGGSAPYGSNHSSTEYVNVGGDPQWAAIRTSQQGSPAFSSMSVPSPRQPSHGISGSAQYTRHSSSSSTGSAYDDYVTSISAPSHKQAFDHSSLYPPGMLLESSTGAGPIRRHRSMTPSLRRVRGRRRRVAVVARVPPVRRVRLRIWLARGQHALEPSYNNIPLAPDYASVRRSDSRNSNLSAGNGGGTGGAGGGGLHEQMRQMMSMNLDPRGGDADAQYVAAGGYAGDMYRSESPAPFTSSPGMYATELPATGQYDAYGQPHPHHAQTVPAHFDTKGLYVMDPQFVPSGDGYYQHPQHVSTI